MLFVSVLTSGVCQFKYLQLLWYEIISAFMKILNYYFFKYVTDIYSYSENKSQSSRHGVFLKWSVLFDDIELRFNN